MKGIEAIIVYLLVTCSFGCNGYRTLLLENNSTDTIYAAAVFAFESNYPDTTLPAEKPSMSYVPPGKKWIFTNAFPSDRVKEEFSKLPKDTLSVYLFDASTYEYAPWNEVRGDYKVLKRYDLSLDDLLKLNWTVQYPPKEVMKDMKQYPSY